MGERTQRTKKGKGVLITFEGIEGSGKTFQCARLTKRLREKGYLVVHTREPGGSALAEGIRRIILDPGLHRERMNPRCEALLILAARSQHIAQTILPALRKGAVVLCDRFSDSTLAYQGHARGLSPRTLRAMNRFATEGITPNLTLLFDVPVPTGLARRRKHGTVQDRIDLEAKRFHEKVRRGFLCLAAKDPGRIKVVDGRPAPDLVTAKTESLVLLFLNKRRHPAYVSKSKRLKVKRSKGHG